MNRANGICGALASAFRGTQFKGFHSSSCNLGGLVWKRRFRLTPTQKYRHRQRLRNVDNVIQTLLDSKVQLKALDQAAVLPRESEMSPREKYWVESKRYRGGLKPVHWVPKWTRVAHPRTWSGSYLHQEPRFGRMRK
ncbi:MAG: hypothetical protein SGCHY_003194 [Lobulomycetales sp.]